MQYKEEKKKKKKKEQKKQYNTFNNVNVQHHWVYYFYITKCSVPERHFQTIMILEYKIKASVINDNDKKIAKVLFFFKEQSSKNNKKTFITERLEEKNSLNLSCSCCNFSQLSRFRLQPS